MNLSTTVFFFLRVSTHKHHVRSRRSRTPRRRASHAPLPRWFQAFIPSGLFMFLHSPLFWFFSFHNSLLFLKAVHHETAGTASFAQNTPKRSPQPSYTPKPAPAPAAQRASPAPAPAPHTIPPPVNRAEVGLSLSSLSHGLFFVFTALCVCANREEEQRKLSRRCPFCS